MVYYHTTPCEGQYIMSSAIMHDMLYLLGGKLRKKVLSVSLPALTQTSKAPAQWHTLPDTPLKYSTAITVCGFLLAVGGRDEDKQRCSAIYMYMTKRRACGERWETYLVNEEVVPLVCYPVGRSLLLEDKTQMAELTKLKWQLYWTKINVTPFPAC